MKIPKEKIEEFRREAGLLCDALIECDVTEVLFESINLLFSVIPKLEPQIRMQVLCDKQNERLRRKAYGEGERA